MLSAKHFLKRAAAVAACVTAKQAENDAAAALKKAFGEPSAM